MNEIIDEYAIICKNAIPISSSVNQKDEVSPLVANVVYLCRDENDNLFVINRIFAIKDELEQLSFESLPFSAFESDYVTQKIETQWLSSYLPRYTTNFQFYMTDDFSQVYTYGIKSDDGRKYKINMSNEMFMGLLFLDKYPLEDETENDHDLALAILNTAKSSENDAEIFRIGSAEVVEMADATFREEPVGFFDKLKTKFSKNELVSSNIAIKFNLTATDDPEKTVQLLAPFDTGEVFDPKKFHGKTVNDLFEGYLEDENHYVANLMVLDAKLLGISKNFMIIRAENKDKNVKLFLIDDPVEEHINNLINEF